MSDTGNPKPAGQTSDQRMNGAQISLHYPEEQQISVLDVLLVVTRYRRIISLSAIVGVCFGVILAILPEEPEYSAEATVIREATTSAVSGPSVSMFRGIGGLGGGAVGLTAQTYPDILMSREVRLAVVRDTFYVSRWDSTLQLVDYLNQPPSSWEGFIRGLERYTVGLPGLLLRAFQSEEPVAVERSNDTAAATPSSSSERAVDTPLYLTSREERAIRNVAGLVSTSVDRDNGLMVIRATTNDPQLSADIILSFLRHLDQRVRAFHTEKARQNLEFVQERLAQVEGELNAAEDVLTQFMDRNTSLQSARLKTEAERRQRQVQFKAQLYEGLQSQLTQAEIELQRSEPVITVMERPVPPRRPAKSHSQVLVLLGLFFGALAGIAVAFGFAFVESKRQQEREKWLEIESSFSAPRLVKRIRDAFSKKGEPVSDE